MVDLGLRAGLAFTVGLGILPVIGGLASLGLVERRSDPAYRAFAAYLAASIFCVCLYTAVKAAYLSTVFSTLDRGAEHDLPLAADADRHARSCSRRSGSTGGSSRPPSAFVLFLVFEKPIQLELPVLRGAGLRDPHDPEPALGLGRRRPAAARCSACSPSGSLLLAFRRFPPCVTAVAAVLCCAWMLTSEIATHGRLHALRRHVPQQPADAARLGRPRHGRAAGRPTSARRHQGPERDPAHRVLEPLAPARLQPRRHARPGPGPTGTPEIVSTRRARSRACRQTAEYVLTDNGVTPAGDDRSTRWGQLTLYRKDGPWRLLDAEQQVYADGWAPEWSTYTYFKPGPARDARGDALADRLQRHARSPGTRGSR